MSVRVLLLSTFLVMPAVAEDGGTRMRIAVDVTPSCSIDTEGTHADGESVAWTCGDDEAPRITTSGAEGDDGEDSDAAVEGHRGRIALPDAPDDGGPIIIRIDF
jgi:hypothetical protein